MWPGSSCPSSPASTTTWSYDIAGSIAIERDTIGGSTKTFSYAYNPDASLRQLTYPGGMQLKYSYNNAGQPTTAQTVNLAPNLTFASNTQYTPHGAVQHVEYGETGPALISIDNNYNERLQPLRMSAGTAGTRLLWLSYDFGLGVANNGNVLQIANNRDAGRTKTFQYDYLNRLKQADTTRWGNTYAYDAWGNLLQKNQITAGKNCSGYPTQCGEYLQQQVDSANHLLGHSYDPAGNQTDGTYAYNAENMLASAGGMIYSYDGDSRRIKKSDGMTYWYGGSNILTETNASSGLNRDYVYFGGQRIAYRDGSGVRYYLKDHLGSSSVVTDGGSNTSEMDYYPFGGDMLPATAERYKFTGKERDTETGLDYFGARYYASNMGRWLSPDWAAKPTAVPYAEFGDPQSLNLYSYVRNNPLSRVDADGHCDSSAHATVNTACQKVSDLRLTDAYTHQLKNAEGEAGGKPILVYKDIGDKQHTVGWGHVDNSVPFGTKIDEKQAQQFFDDDIAPRLQFVRDVLSSNGGHEWSFGEFTALVDLTYQAGTGILSKQSSPNLMKAIEKGDYDAGSKELRATRINGQPAPPNMKEGMEKRSNMREDIWNGKDPE